jgi:hypothetical protein
MIIIDPHSCTPGEFPESRRYVWITRLCFLLSVFAFAAGADAWGRDGVNLHECGAFHSVAVMQNGKLCEGIGVEGSGLFSSADPACCAFRIEDAFVDATNDKLPSLRITLNRRCCQSVGATPACARDLKEQK